MAIYFNGYSSRSKNQEFGTYMSNNVERFQQFTRREKLNGRIQNLQQGNGVKPKTINYWGKVRKCAVRTRNTFKPWERRRNIWSLKGEIGNARQVFEKRCHRVTKENKSLISGKIPKKYGVGGAMRSNTNTYNVGCKRKRGAEKSVSNEGEERKKLLNTYRAVCESLRNGFVDCNRIDLEAYKVLKESGELFMTEKKVGTIPGVKIEDCFEFRTELVIMGIHSLFCCGIDYMETSNGRDVATSIVATEGYGDRMRADELIYRGQGVKDQELKMGNLALINSMEEGNYVRVVRGVKSSGKNMKATRTTLFVYDGLYKVVAYEGITRENGDMKFEFTLERCPNQKIINWAKYK